MDSSSSPSDWPAQKVRARAHVPYSLSPPGERIQWTEPPSVHHLHPRGVGPPLPLFLLLSCLLLSRPWLSPSSSLSHSLPALHSPHVPVWSIVTWAWRQNCPATFFIHGLRDGTHLQETRHPASTWEPRHLIFLSSNSWLESPAEWSACARKQISAMTEQQTALHATCFLGHTRSLGGSNSRP